MIVLLCPQCRYQSIGDDAAIVQCGHCGQFHNSKDLRKMTPFAGSLWIRQATPEEEEKERLLRRAEVFERIGKRLRIMSDQVKP